MTGLPAQVFSIRDRGTLAVGCWADVVVFDPKTVADRATYEQPVESPIGIPWVVVNGRIAIADRKFNGTRAGQVLRHDGKAK